MFAEHWGRHGHRGFFERGGLKYAILDLLRDKPRHGYEIIREFEDRSGGFYSPSPGAVYPTLQMLEDQGYVRSREDEGKKVYEVTEAGLTYSDEHRERMREHRERAAMLWSPANRREAQSLMRDLKVAFRDVVHAARRSVEDPEKLAAIRDVLQDAKRRIEDIASGKGSEESKPAE